MTQKMNPFNIAIPLSATTPLNHLHVAEAGSWRRSFAERRDAGQHQRSTAERARHGR
jgi:hypothetical protein